MGRPSPTDNYLHLAEVAAERGTCLRRNYGAVIVKNNEIISTGYTGAPRGMPNCIDVNKCEREKRNIPSGSNYELCQSVHAEMNAIISAARKDMLEGVMYLVGKDAKTGRIIYTEPCNICKKLIINSGLERVIAKKADGENKIFSIERWVEKNFIFNK